MTINTWFHQSHLKLNKKIIIDDLHGYVLPHASTKYTGHILSHTLRFQPKKHFNHINIIYYPAYDEENIIDNDGQKYYHEYYVIWKTLAYVIKNFWKLPNANKIKFKGFNVRENPDINIPHMHSHKNTDLIIVSADFSHFKEMHEALALENCAAHSLMHRKYDTDCNHVVDHIKSFELLYRTIPNTFMLQWVGRTRSDGVKGVGYLSFLIRNHILARDKGNADGVFVTAYDDNMIARECLGEWFTKKDTSKNKKVSEHNLINKVINLAKTSSRLTGGRSIRVDGDYYYTITYLYKDHINTKLHNFIRGWHGIMHNAFYLPDVMLENTFNNGTWITHHNHTWKRGNKFNIKQTLRKLTHKAQHNTSSSTKSILYYTRVEHNKYH